MWSFVFNDLQPKKSAFFEFLTAPEPGVRPEIDAKPWRGDRKWLRIKISRPCRGSLNAISYPGVHTPGYYLLTPPGPRCEDTRGVSRQKLDSCCRLGGSRQVAAASASKAGTKGLFHATSRHRTPDQRSSAVCCPFVPPRRQPNLPLSRLRVTRRPVPASVE